MSSDVRIYDSEEEEITEEATASTAEATASSRTVSSPPPSAAAVAHQQQMTQLGLSSAFVAGGGSSVVSARGDPRMNRALHAKLQDPRLSLIDALLAGGFEFPQYNKSNLGDRKVYDSDGTTTLYQRKNQLMRRLRKAREEREKAAARAQAEAEARRHSEARSVGGGGEGERFPPPQGRGGGKKRRLSLSSFASVDAASTMMDDAKLPSSYSSSGAGSIAPAVTAAVAAMPHLEAHVAVAAAQMTASGRPKDNMETNISPECRAGDAALARGLKESDTAPPRSPYSSKASRRDSFLDQILELPGVASVPPHHVHHHEQDCLGGTSSSAGSGSTSSPDVGGKQDATEAGGTGGHALAASLTPPRSKPEKKTPEAA